MDQIHRIDFSKRDTIVVAGIIMIIVWLIIMLF